EVQDALVEKLDRLHEGDTVVEVRSVFAARLVDDPLRAAERENDGLLVDVHDEHRKVRGQAGKAGEHDQDRGESLEHQFAPPSLPFCIWSSGRYGTTP